MAVLSLPGASIFYETVGKGSAVVIMHGMLETGRTHARLALILSAHYRVVQPDLRGYGRSLPSPRVFTPDFYQQDATDILALIQHLGLHDVRVVGTGDGSESALLLALAAPTLIRAVVAIDVVGALSPSILGELDAWGDWTEAGVLVDGNPHRLRAVTDYGMPMIRQMWDGWKSAIRTLVTAGGNISLDQASGILCPVLIINGQNDPLNTAAERELLGSTIPHCEVLVVPDLDQLVYSGQQERQWLLPILDWCDAH